MNFLQIAQRLRVESGLTSSISVSPTTVVAQAGELARIVNWAKDAYTDLQTSKTNWRWLRSRFTIPTVAGTDTYAYTAATDQISSSTISRFARWIPLADTGEPHLTCYRTATGVSDEQMVYFMPWPDFRDEYKRRTQNNGRPLHFTIDPQNNLVFGPKPDAIYTVVGEYQKSAQTLALDADTPEMPSDYHMLIVWNALLDYAGYSAAPEAFTRAQVKAKPLKSGLEIDQLPDFHF